MTDPPALDRWRAAVREFRALLDGRRPNTTAAEAAALADVFEDQAPAADDPALTAADRAAALALAAAVARKAGVLLFLPRR